MIWGLFFSTKKMWNLETEKMWNLETEKKGLTGATSFSYGPMGIEKCINLLKPSGKMAIVLPNGILENSTL